MSLLYESYCLKIQSNPNFEMWDCESHLNSIIEKSSYAQYPLGHLDSSWIAFGSVQSSGLDLEPKGHNSILLLSSYIACNLIITKSSYAQYPLGQLDSSWIASRSVQNSGLNLEPKWHNSILLLSSYIACNSIITKFSYSQYPLDTWIPLGWHLHQSKVLDWAWIQKA